MPLIHSPERRLNKTSPCYTTNCWCAGCRDILVQTIVHSMPVSSWTHQLFAELQQKSHMKDQGVHLSCLYFCILDFWAMNINVHINLFVPRFIWIITDQQYWNSFFTFSNLITQTEILRLSIQILQIQIALLQKWPHSLGCYLVFTLSWPYDMGYVQKILKQTRFSDMIKQQHCLCIVIVTHAVDLYRQQVRKLKHKVWGLTWREKTSTDSCLRIQYESRWRDGVRHVMKVLYTCRYCHGWQILILAVWLYI